MKRFLSILITMLAIGAIVSPNINAGNDRNKKKVYVTTAHKRGWFNRDLPSDVKVYYYSDEDLIELACYETKETTVYILTSGGEELSCDTFNSELTPLYTIDAPDTPGTYWIVIDSPVIYAEGSFVVE